MRGGWRGRGRCCSVLVKVGCFDGLVVEWGLGAV